MGSVPHPRWSVGSGRGRGQQALEFWEDRPGRNPGPSYVRRDPVSNFYKLHVRSIPSTWTTAILTNVFSRCGVPKSVYMHPHRAPNTLTWGFVEFEHYNEAATAVKELHNNVLLNIQVSFARERPSGEDVDPILKLLASEPEEMIYRSTESLVDPKTLVKTVKNDNPYRADIPVEDYHKPVLDPETLRYVEEALFQRILNIYKEGDCPTAKCNVCEADCAMACSGCVSVFYCSENCQSRDWASHSRNCKGASAVADEDTMSYSRGGGDQRQAKNEFVNGYGSSDNRTNRFSADRRNNKNVDKGFDRDSDRGYNRDRGQRMDQNASSQQGKKTLFEERKARMNFSGRQSETDRPFQNQNNQRFQNSQEKSNSFKPRISNEKTDEDWDSPKDVDVKDVDVKDVDVKDAMIVTTPGLDFINKEKAFLQMIEPNKQDGSTLTVTAPEEAKVSIKTEEESLQPGSVFEVMVTVLEDQGLLCVQKTSQMNQLAPLTRNLEDHFTTSNSQFDPVLDGVCGIKYEDKWYRCQVTSLEPLIVHYIDLGYPETVEPSRLYELTSELKSLPPLAFKIKLTNGKSKEEGDTVVVKLVEKADGYWLSEIVDDDIKSQGIPETVTTNDTPVSLPSSTPAVAVSAEPTSTAQAQAPLQSPAEQPSVLQPFPVIFSATNFTTVIVTCSADSELKDTYYVGAETIWEALTEMCQHFKGVIHHCQVLTPKHGTKGLALYLGQWYRARVVSLNPLLVYYVDYGNIAEIEPDGLRSCPESHMDVPHLVHKIKLAPGTNQKYFNIPDESEISVKPVSWLADSTIVVEVEGENYSEVTASSQVHEEPSSPATSPTPATATSPATSPTPATSPLPATAPLSATTPSSATAPSSATVPSPATTPSPAAAPSSATVSSPSTTPLPATTPSPAAPPSSASVPSPATTPSPAAAPSLGSTSIPSRKNSSASDTSRASASLSSSTLADTTLSRPESIVDLLQEKWKISFVPSKVDFVNNTLLGQVYSEHIPTTFSFMVDDKYQMYLSSQQFDPKFKPNVGEIVGFRVPSGDWERGRVLPQQGLVAFYDMCSVICCSQLFKLTESFVNVPSMAAVLVLRKEDPDLLNCLVEMEEIIFDVVKVVNETGHSIVHVSNNDSQETLEGHLKRWDYDPLTTPNPLGPGESVIISRVIDSNTLLVTPADDLEIQQVIQIDCRKNREEFKTPPKEGDYIAFLDEESDGYFRCRIDKVEGDDCQIYCVDNATYYTSKLSDLRPLPSSLHNIPCRITQIQLKGVDKVVPTEQSQIYLSHIVEQDKSVTIETISDGKATLTVEGEEDTLNSKLKELLVPQVVPDEEGKLTILSLPELQVPLNQKFEFVVSQTDPLYVQLVTQSFQYYKELHQVLQDHCAKDNALYNPCEGELCLALFDGDWYRCRCLKETNTGVSFLMLVDYGNIFEAQTSNIRRILPEMLTMPSIAIPCKVHGLPDPVPQALKERLNEILIVDVKLCGEFVAENDGCYEVVIESVDQVIKELQKTG